MPHTSSKTTLRPSASRPTGGDALVLTLLNGSAVTGGNPLVSGDGLELHGGTLFAVRGSGTSTVTVLTLCRTSIGWTATNRGDIGSPLLDVPSTATLNHGSLYAVNGRFGVASPATATYSVTRLPVRP